MLIGFALAILLAREPQDVDPEQLRKWVASLDSEEAKTREEAEARLLEAGRSIRPLLHSLLPRLSPEQKGRVEAILQRFIIDDEEDFALQALKKGDPFPLPPPAPDVWGDPWGPDAGMPLAETISIIAKRFALKIEFFAADTMLRREAERAEVQESAHTQNGDAEYLLTAALTSTLDAWYVTEKDRVVIVRLTPKLLLERLARSEEWRFDVESRLDTFGGWVNRHMMTVGAFLQGCYSRGGPRFARWQDALKSIALDPRRPVRDRLNALTGLRWFRGIDNQAQPEASAVLIRLASDQKAPPQVRAEAGSSLAYCLDPEAQEKALALLEQGDAPFAAPLLVRMVERNTAFQGALKGIQSDEKRRARLIAALENLERGTDRDLALRALIVRSVFAREGPVLLRLAKAEVPADLQTLRIFIEGLRVAASGNVPEVWDLIDRLAANPSARMRASAAQIYGRRVGGKDRARDAKGALALLQDKEPIVRWGAAEALRYIYQIPGASEPYDEDWESCEPRLQKALTVETHPKVRDSLERALKRR